MAKLPEITWTPEFIETHDYYDSDDEEQLTNRNLFDYLEQLICGGNLELDEAIAENKIIEVFAYGPMKFARPRSRIVEMLEDIGDDDGMCDPDGDHEPITAEEQTELEELEGKLIDRMCALYKPWGCEPVAIIKVPFRDWWDSLDDKDKELLRG
jgi:hypothetical protein